MFSGCVAFSALLGKDTGLNECSQCPVSPGEVGGMSDPLVKVSVVVQTVTSGESISASASLGNVQVNVTVVVGESCRGE